MWMYNQHMSHVHCRDFDYGDVQRELRKVITKDSNVMCVAEAVACVGALAQGLRSAFAATSKGFTEVRGGGGTACVGDVYVGGWVSGWVVIETEVQSSELQCPVVY
jgi:hypothetical protein